VSTRLQLARKARELTQSQVIAELTRRAEAKGLTIASPASLKMMLSRTGGGKSTNPTGLCSARSTG
jgi:hypothetical protein